MEGLSYMAALLKGIDVILYDKVQTGVDSLNAPIYTETPVIVKNVLVSPVGTSDVVSELQLSGKRAEYELSIPKGDTHTWEDRKVSFFGEDWHTFGFSTLLIEHLVPLDWNRKVRVERYG